MENEISHDGIVISTCDGSVQVKVEVQSACGTCEAHGHCGFAEKKDRIFSIDTPHWKDFQPGDSVEVLINQKHGFVAVLWAYIFPSILLIATPITLLLSECSELFTVGLSLLVLALYVALLFLLRKRLQKKFTFKLKKRRIFAD